MKTSNIFSRNLKNNSGNIDKDWTVITKKGGKHCVSSDTIYVTTRTSKNKVKHDTTLVTMYFGKSITELVGFNNNDEVDFMLANNDPYIVRVRKTINDNHGYKLSITHKDSNLRSSFTAPKDLVLKRVDVREVYFELLEDKSIVVDLSSLKPGKDEYFRKS
jgi:hypothetical protein